VPDCAQLSPDPLFPYIYPVQNTSAILLEPLHIQNSCICPAFSTVVAAGCGIAGFRLSALHLGLLRDAILRKTY
jgi:hypothetical protein